MKKLKTYIEYINESKLIEKVSLAWLRNTSNLIKKGKTLNDQSLRNQGRKEVILAYFPMANPDWKPSFTDVLKYLNKNPKYQKKVIGEINTQLEKLDNKKLVSSRYSKNLGTLAKVPLGYFNADYWADLGEVRLQNYTDKDFTGTVDVSGGTKVPDGVFKGMRILLNSNSKFKVGFTGRIKDDQVILDVYPKDVKISTSWLTAKSSLDGLSTAAKVAIGLLYPVSGLFKFRVNNNKVEMKLRAFDKDWFTTVVYTIDANSIIKKELKNVEVKIPISTLKNGKLPTDLSGYTTLAKNVAGGLKVSKT